jgi:Plant transposon protein
MASPTAKVLAAMRAKVAPHMARALGGENSFQFAMQEVMGNDTDKEDENEDEDEDDDELDSDMSYDAEDLSNLDDESMCDEMNAAPGVDIKKRKTSLRKKKEHSPWWRMYLADPCKTEMETEPRGQLARNFRRNFRFPYPLYKTAILGMATARFWPTWDYLKVDAFHKPICDLELKLLGALYVLANGATHFSVSELSYMSEEVHRCFFLTWTSHMASVKDEFIHFPRDDAEYNFVVEEYAKLGFPGCVGSVDCVHIGWEKCPFQWKNLFKGKEKYPSVAYEVVCTSRKFIQSVSPGHPGSRNDKHIARTDPAIMNLLNPNHWLSRKTWEVTDDAEGGKRVYHGCYLLCDGGYHRWPCLCFPIKTGLPGSNQRKWSAIVESIRKDIEGTFGILKMRFRYLKNFNRSHSVSDIDNSFVTCCILHNMLLEDDGYLDINLQPQVGTRTFTIRRIFRAGAGLDGLWNRGEDDTPDPEMELEEARHCRYEKMRLESQWRKTTEALMNHYQFAAAVTRRGTT